MIVNCQTGEIIFSPEEIEAAKKPIIPYSITPRQCRLALLQMGMLDQVEAIIAGRDQETQIAWEYSVTFERNNPLLISLAEDLGLDSEQIDQFFIMAEKL